MVKVSGLFLFGYACSAGVDPDTMNYWVSNSPTVFCKIAIQLLWRIYQIYRRWLEARQWPGAWCSCVTSPPSSYVIHSAIYV